MKDLFVNMSDKEEVSKTEQLSENVVNVNDTYLVSAQGRWCR